MQSLNDAFTTLTSAANRHVRLEAAFTTLANNVHTAIESWRAQEHMIIERKAAEFNIKIAGRCVKFTFSSKLTAEGHLGIVTCWLDEEIPTKTLLKISEFTFNGTGAIKDRFDPTDGDQLYITHDVSGITVVFNLLIDAMSSSA